MNKKVNQTGNTLRPFCSVFGVQFPSLERKLPVQRGKTCKCNSIPSSNKASSICCFVFFAIRWSAAIRSVRCSVNNCSFRNIKNRSYQSQTFEKNKLFIIFALLCFAWPGMAWLARHFFFYLSLILLCSAMLHKGQVSFADSEVQVWLHLAWLDLFLLG